MPVHFIAGYRARVQPGKGFVCKDARATSQLRLCLDAANIGAFTPDASPGGTFIFAGEHELVRRRDDKGRWLYSPTSTSSTTEVMMSEAANEGLRAAEHVDPSWWSVDHVTDLQFIKDLVQCNRGTLNKYEPVSDVDESAAGSAEEEPFDEEQFAKELDYKRKPSKRPSKRPAKMDKPPQKRNVSWEDGTLLLRVQTGTPCFER